MLGADEAEEMRQFYVVNSTAKSLRTGLAYDLLKQQAEASPDIMQNLIDEGQDSNVRDLLPSTRRDAVSEPVLH